MVLDESLLYWFMLEQLLEEYASIKYKKRFQFYRKQKKTKENKRNKRNKKIVIILT